MMITGIILRQFKAYDKLAYIPLSNGDNFMACVGENGAGKSSLLEALNCFFENAPWPDSYAGEEMHPFLVPFFAISHEELEDPELCNAASMLERMFQKLLAEDNGQSPFRDLLRRAWKESRKISAASNGNPAKNTSYILPLFYAPDENQIRVLFPTLPAEDDSFISSIKIFRDWILHHYHYLYIPATIGEPCFSGKDLSAEPYWRSLTNVFPDSDSQNLYSQEIPRMFCRLSSGERKVRWLSLIGSLVKKYPDISRTLIIAFDEPETFLQTSSCYDQFEAIYSLKRFCAQIFIASHWYGFVPMLTSGILVDIIAEKEGHQVLKFDISRFREEIKIRKRLYKERYHEQLPVDIMVKSLNDFIQSLLGGVTGNPPYNWLICEGSSEKIFFNYYFREQIEHNRLRIVPVGGVREVKKIYNYLAVAFNDLQEYINGRIVLLTDTDAQLSEFNTYSIHHLNCFRLINYNGRTELVHISSNPKSPATEIEDVLNGRVFHQALATFKSRYPVLLDFVNPEEEKPEIPSYYAMDLSLSQQAKLTAFFDAHYENKVRFAERYIAICQGGDYKTPPWIQKLINLFSEPDH